MTTDLLDEVSDRSCARITGPRLVRVTRRGPVLRPSHSAAGVYGVDLTAGCLIGCGFCHIRGSARYPGEDRVLFDPFSVDGLAEELDRLEMRPRQVVLSPMSDPFPPLREVRLVAEKVVALLLERDVPVALVTRGRLSARLIALLAAHPGRSRVLIGLITIDKGLSRALEPRAASPAVRIRDVRRLVDAGIEVEVRLEPLIPERTDTRENLLPLFQGLARSGAHSVMAHYLFLQPAMIESLDASIASLGWSEWLRDKFEGGPSFHLGSLGPSKHLPLETRRVRLAQVIALGAEFGLRVATGASQNPDLPVTALPAFRFPTGSPDRPFP